MKPKRQGFNFLGFVALADCLFAVSAGLLLLNPIRFDARPSKPSRLKPEPPPPVQAILVEMQQVEKRLDDLETGGLILQRRAAEVLKNE